MSDVTSDFRENFEPQVNAPDNLNGKVVLDKTITDWE